MYQVGDLILYGNTGVCRVTDIQSRKLYGEERTCYELHPLYQECMISTPVDAKVFMRPIISKEEANELIDMIPNVQGKIFHSSVLSQLADHYEQSFKNHDCADLIKLTKSIYNKRQLVTAEKRRFGAVDQKYMKRAEDLLYGELAAALEIPVADVPDYINQRLGTDSPTTQGA